MPKNSKNTFSLCKLFRKTVGRLSRGLGGIEGNISGVLLHHNKHERRMTDECRNTSDHVTSDATIHRPNDISSRYWPYRIVSISSRKISKFRYIVFVSISFQYQRNDVDVVYLFSFL